MNGPVSDGSVIVDIDGVPVLAHSEKQDANATWKKTFGHHPLVAFVRPWPVPVSRWPCCGGPETRFAELDFLPGKRRSGANGD